MIQVKQFHYGTDNLGYLVFDDRFALAVDGGDAGAIQVFLTARKLKLLWVSNTHAHPDHTCGNETLIRKTGARLIGYPEVIKPGIFQLGARDIQVIPTPGHSMDSVCFYFANILLTGDTLFNGTVGNCFTGDLRGFYESVRRIMELPSDTIIYAGHDYVKMAMEFLRWLDPEERAVDSFLRKYDPGHVYSYLKDELVINPYLRFDDPRIIALLQKRGLETGDSWQRWLSIMSIE